MTESYELPVLLAEEERKAYAAWGSKKEKVLIPFAIVTVLLYILAGAWIAGKVWGLRGSDHLLFQILVQGSWIPEATGALAILMTVLLLGPLDFLLDKVWRRPAEPMWLRVEPDGGNVKVVPRGAYGGKHPAPAEYYPLSELSAFLNPVDNTILYQKKWWKIGENTIETIYPPEKQHPWMDHPENKVTGITRVQHLMEILQGYAASLEAIHREQEWLKTYGTHTEQASSQ